MSEDHWECVGPVNVWVVGFWGELIGTVIFYPNRFMWTWMLESQDVEHMLAGDGLIGHAPTFEAAKKACEEAALIYETGPVPRTLKEGDTDEDL